MVRTELLCPRLFNAACALAATLAIVLTVVQWTPEPDLARERRRPAPAPDWSFDRVWKGQAFAEFERYLNDRFFPRAALVNLKNRVQVAIFGKSREDLIYGSDDYVFYRFIANEHLVPSASVDRWVAALRRLRALGEKTGKRIIFQHFRTKEFIYQDKLPYVWRHLAFQTPLVKAGEIVAKEGITVIDFTEDLLRTREHGVAFTPREENHCSPEAFFLAFQRIIRVWGAVASVKVQPPTDFPKVRSSSLAVMGYRQTQWVNTNYPHAAPWTRVIDRKNDGTIFEASSTDGPLPPTVVYSDSFMEVLTREFGAAFLPYFRKFTLHWGNAETQGWKDAKLVVVNVSDQSPGLVLILEKLIARVEAGER